MYSPAEAGDGFRGAGRGFNLPSPALKAGLEGCPHAKIVIDYQNPVHA
jgi:hypothetical protein